MAECNAHIRRSQLINHLREHEEPRNLNQLVEATGLHKSQVSTDMKALERDGIITIVRAPQTQAQYIANFRGITPRQLLTRVWTPA